MSRSVILLIAFPPRNRSMLWIVSTSIWSLLLPRIVIPNAYTDNGSKEHPARRGGVVVHGCYRSARSGITRVGCLLRSTIRRPSGSDTSAMNVASGLEQEAAINVMLHASKGRKWRPYDAAMFRKVAQKRQGSGARRWFGEGRFPCKLFYS